MNICDHSQVITREREGEMRSSRVFVREVVLFSDQSRVFVREMMNLFHNSSCICVGGR